MEELTKNASRGDLIPVLLGLSQKTLENAKYLYQRCDAVSHVFCSMVPLPLRLSVCMRFHRVGHTKGEELMLRALLDFSEQIGNQDTNLYLIPCTQEYAKLIKQHRKLLEGRFLIAASAKAEDTAWEGAEI